MAAVNVESSAFKLPPRINVVTSAVSKQEKMGTAGKAMNGGEGNAKVMTSGDEKMMMGAAAPTSTKNSSDLTMATASNDAAGGETNTRDPEDVMDESYHRTSKKIRVATEKDNDDNHQGTEDATTNAAATLRPGDK